jgi:hypothetical protein
MSKELEMADGREVVSGAVHFERPLDGAKSTQKYVFTVFFMVFF